MHTHFVRKLREKTRKLVFNNALYNWSLGSTVPDRLAVIPTDSWAGDAENGRWLCSGAFSCGGDQLHMRGEVWEPEGVSDAWLDHMHGFDWLRDLRALGGDQPRQQARGMIEHWLDRYESWHSFSWRPDIAGQRIASWIALYEFYGDSACPDFQRRLFESLIRQARHVSRTVPAGLHGIALLQAIRGLAFAGLAFHGREGWLAQALDLLQDETDRQILPDGGHVSRNPAKLLDALRIFIDIRAALAAGNYPVPEQIGRTIDRMAQALRFFRYADRHLATMNGAQEGDLALLDAVAAATGAQGRVLRGLPHSGYERITQGRSLLMLDAGVPAAFPDDETAHAAPLAFEFSCGKERIFVSCGIHPLDEQWQELLRGTAAHNTITVDNRNACEIRPGGHLGRKPRKIMMTRDETRDAVLIDAMHDGYLPINGITHRRRLMLGNQGHDLRGEENLTCTTGLGKPVQIALRFHLHPRVLVSLIRDGKEALLRMPGGAGWRFVHNNGLMEIEDSIYCGQGAHPRKTKQIVIYGTMEDDYACLKWALQREGS